MNDDFSKQSEELAALIANSSNENLLSVAKELRSEAVKSGSLVVTSAKVKAAFEKMENEKRDPNDICPYCGGNLIQPDLSDCPDHAIADAPDLVCDDCGEPVYV